MPSSTLPCILRISRATFHSRAHGQCHRGSASSICGRTRGLSYWHGTDEQRELARSTGLLLFLTLALDSCYYSDSTPNLHHFRQYISQNKLALSPNLYLRNRGKLCKRDQHHLPSTLIFPHDGGRHHARVLPRIIRAVIARPAHAHD